VVNSPPTVKPEIFGALAAVGKSFRAREGREWASRYLLSSG